MLVLSIQEQNTQNVERVIENAELPSPEPSEPQTTSKKTRRERVVNQLLKKKKEKKQKKMEVRENPLNLDLGLGIILLNIFVLSQENVGLDVNGVRQLMHVIRIGMVQLI